MTIIQFPVKAAKQAVTAVPPTPFRPIGDQGKSASTGAKVARATVDIAWTVLMVTWPLLGRLLPLDIVFQLLRMLFYWETPGMHAGWTCMLHFGGYLSLYMFLVFHKPTWH